MTEEKMQDDIAWIKQLAEEGRNAPLTGGSISIWWGALSFVMLLVHWAALSERIAYPIEKIGFGWIAYAILGVTGTFILQARLRGRPGAGSMGNQVSGAAWMMVMAGIFTFVAGCVFGVIIMDLPSWIFNAILPVSFLCYGIAHGVTAQITHHKASALGAMASFALAFFQMPFLQSPSLYLIAAFGMLAVTILPVVARNKAS